VDTTERGEKGWQEAQRQGEDRVTLQITLLPQFEVHPQVSWNWTCFVQIIVVSGCGLCVFKKTLEFMCQGF
jgi:hypothetical protein